MADFAPVHPGEILRIEFLEPLGISTYRLAKAIDVPQTRLSEILRGRARYHRRYRTAALQSPWLE